MRNDYSKQELQYLRRNYRYNSIKNLAAKIERSEIGVAFKLRGEMKKHPRIYNKDRVMALYHDAYRIYSSTGEKEPNIYERKEKKRNQTIDTLVDKGLDMPQIGEKVDLCREAISQNLDKRKRKKHYLRIQTQVKKKEILLEKKTIKKYVLEGKNKEEINDILGQGVSTIYKKIKKYGLKEKYHEKLNETKIKEKEQIRAKQKAVLTDLINQEYTAQEIADKQNKKRVTTYKDLRRFDLTDLLQETQDNKEIREIEQEYPGIDKFVKKGLSKSQITQELSPPRSVTETYLRLKGKTEWYRERQQKKKEQKLKRIKKRVKKLKEQGKNINEIARILHRSGYTIKHLLEE